jgi:hypothetical protein
LDAPRTLPEKPHTEDLTVFLVLSLPIFGVTVAVLALILQLSPS